MNVSRYIKAMFFSMLLMLPLSVAAEERININTATVSELATVLNGIGESKAQAIVEHREENGPFSTVDDLVQVKGIGRATVSKNLDRMTVGTEQ